MNIAIIYGSSEGQTASIARIMAQTARKAGHTVRLTSGDTIEDDFPFQDYDAVIVGASVHHGEHQPYMAELVKRHRDVLKTRPTAFFSVSLTAHDIDDPVNRRLVKGYIREFIDETGWKADTVAAFGGALLPSQYGPLKRLKLRLANLRIQDDGHDQVFTDWQAVQEFTRHFMLQAGTPASTA